MIECVAISTTMLFTYCYFGNLVTEHFETFADSLYNSDWQCLSISLQKHIHIMMIDAQVPQVYLALGAIELNLMVFKKVNITFQMKSTEVDQLW